MKKIMNNLNVIRTDLIDWVADIDEYREAFKTEWDIETDRKVLSEIADDLNHASVAVNRLTEAEEMILAAIDAIGDITRDGIRRADKMIKQREEAI